MGYQSSITSLMGQVASATGKISSGIKHYNAQKVAIKRADAIKDAQRHQAQRLKTRFEPTKTIGESNDAKK